MCPKDDYPLSSVNHLLSLIHGYPLRLQVGYVAMRWDDEKKTRSITKKGTFCFTVMLFVLRNVDKVFQQWIENLSRD